MLDDSNSMLWLLPAGMGLVLLFLFIIKLFGLDEGDGPDTRPW